jgi:predicted hotdog family 3-hydroxylacyl-ACP dehydratase
MSEIEFSKQLKQLAGMPAAEFVLHREPMLLLDRLVDVEPGYALCEWRVLDSSPFAVPGCGVPAYIGIEYMAQGIAVYAGARARVHGLLPPLGFLLGTRHYQTTTQFFQLGVTYRLACRELIRDAEGMGSYDCRILHHDKSVAEGRLTVLEKQQGERIDG